MNLPTRVPASSVVRMKSASNMMAKWYQSPSMLAPPKTLWNIMAMPTAKVGAPPVFPMSVGSFISAARFCISARVTGKPAALTRSMTAWCTATVGGSAGVLMAKYWPGWRAQAAMMALSATSISVTMLP